MNPVGNPLNFRNQEEIDISGPFNKTCDLLYFIRCGRTKPSCFDKVYSSSGSAVALSLYEEPDWCIPPDCIVIAGGLSKYHAFHKARDRLSFNFVFLLDADIELPGFSESRLLSQLRSIDINCVQYSLSDDSYASHRFHKHSGKPGLRRVNFVEVMAPIFTNRSVDRVLETFPMAISTWGLDFAWMKIFSGNKMYVLDSEIMVHLGKPDTKDGPFYKYLRTLGVSPEQELQMMKNRFACDDVVIGNLPPLVPGLLYGRARSKIARWCSAI